MRDDDADFKGYPTYPGDAVEWLQETVEYWRQHDPQGSQIDPKMPRDNREVFFPVSLHIAEPLLDAIQQRRGAPKRTHFRKWAVRNTVRLARKMRDDGQVLNADAAARGPKSI